MVPEKRDQPPDGFLLRMDSREIPDPEPMTSEEIMGGIEAAIAESGFDDVECRWVDKSQGTWRAAFDVKVPSGVRRRCVVIPVRASSTKESVTATMVTMLRRQYPEWTKE